MNGAAHRGRKVVKLLLSTVKVPIKAQGRRADATG
ncbi:MAG: hypothetical protein RL011_527, partial [Pseudomonadota bacterium]